MPSYSLTFTIFCPHTKEEDILPRYVEDIITSLNNHGIAIRKTKSENDGLFIVGFDNIEISVLFPEFTDMVEDEVLFLFDTFMRVMQQVSEALDIDPYDFVLYEQDGNNLTPAFEAFIDSDHGIQAKLSETRTASFSHLNILLELIEVPMASHIKFVLYPEEQQNSILAYRKAVVLFIEQLCHQYPIVMENCSQVQKLIKSVRAL